MKLSIVVPVFNEEGNLRLLHERLGAVLKPHADEYEIIFVNDGSRDGSLAIIRDLASLDPNVRYLSFSRNFGHEVATTAGVDAATGNAVVLIDADLQDPPEIIPQLIEKWRNGCHVAYARRRSRDGEPLFKRIAAYAFYRLLNSLAECHIPPDTGDFRIMDRRVVEALKLCRESPRYVRGLVSWVGFRQDAVLYDRAARHSGRTKYHLFKLLRLSWESICSFSIVPLRVVIWFGAAMTAFSFGLAAIIAVQKVFFNQPFKGYPLLACGIFFLGGVQLVMLGVIAQYVAILLKLAQRRPLYVIEERGGWAKTDG